MKGHTLPGINQKIDKPSVLLQKETAISYYQDGTKAIQNAVNEGATTKEIRGMVLAHNAETRNMNFKGGSAKAKISFNSVKNYTPDQEVVEEEETVIIPSDRKKVVKPAAEQGTYRKDAGFISPDSFLSK